jgi:hypothetical protein
MRTLAATDATASRIAWIAWKTFVIAERIVATLAFTAVSVIVGRTGATAEKIAATGAKTAAIDGIENRHSKLVIKRSVIGESLTIGALRLAIYRVIHQ